MWKYILVLSLLDCQRANFNNIAEGAGGVLIGFHIKQATNQILITNQPEKITEGSSAEFALRISQRPASPISLTIESNQDTILINQKKTESFLINQENWDRNNFITLQSVEDSNRISEEVTITVKGEGLESGKFTFIVEDLISRKIQVQAPSQVNEGNSFSVGVSLGIQPEKEITVELQGNVNGVFQLDKTSLSFTPSNYNIPQTVNAILNDNFNENKTYILQANADGETKETNLLLIDNDYKYQNLGLESEEHSGYNPSIVLDLLNGKILIATKKHNPLVNTETKLYLYKSSLSGEESEKIYHSIFDFSSSPDSKNSLLYPKIHFDKSRNRVYTITAFRGIGYKLFDCSIDLASCSPLVIDYFLTRVNQVIQTNAGLFITSGNDYNYSNQNPIPVYLSKYHPSSNHTFLASYILEDVHNGGGNPYDISRKDILDYSARGIVFDEINQKILTVFTGKTNTSYYIPIMKRINENGTGLETIPLSSTNQSGITPDLQIDTVNNKIIVLSINHFQSKLWLTRCDLNGTSCTEKDISTGIPTSSYFPKLVLDPSNQKLWAFFYNTTFHLYAVQCDLEGNNCKFKDISFGNQVITSSEEPHFDALLDTINQRIVLVFTNRVTGKLSLVRFGLSGF
jgi:hypothetical protein